MAIGRRKDRPRTPGFWIATHELPVTGGHPFISDWISSSTRTRLTSSSKRNVCRSACRFRFGARRQMPLISTGGQRLEPW